EVGDFESLEALRKVVREDLEKEAEREADAQVRRDLIEQIVQANRVAAPRPLVERALAVYAQAYGIPEDRWPDFAQEFRPVAEAQVRRDLILDWVVEHHGLRATEAELEQKLQEIATRRGTPVAEVRATLEKAKRLRDLERGLTEEKVFTFLLSQSTVEPAGRGTRFIPPTSSSAPAGASAPTTSSAGCSWTASCSWAPRSTTKS